MSKIETIGADGWLYATLSGDATLAAIIGLRVYRDVAPNKDAVTGVAPLYPLCVFSLNGSEDSNAMGAARVMVRARYTVKIIGEETSFVGLQTAVNRMDTLLRQTTASNVTLSGVTYQLLGAFRERIIGYTEVLNGKTYTHIGGLYRLITGVT